MVSAIAPLQELEGMEREGKLTSAQRLSADVGEEFKHVKLFLKEMK